MYNTHNTESLVNYSLHILDKVLNSTLSNTMVLLQMVGKFTKRIQGSIVMTSKEYGI